MSENKKQENNNQGKFGFNRPNPDGAPNGKPKFNVYWVYGAIILAILLLQFYSTGPSATEVSWRKFRDEMLRPGDVERVVIVNGKTAEIYIKPDRLSGSKYDDAKSSSGMGGSFGPQYFISIVSADSFEKRMEEAQADLPETDRIYAGAEERKNFMDMFGWLLPIVVLVAVWIFILRRMGGGSAGPGAIFNVGKSKAQLFDKESEIKINFKNVAGLEEAKTEVMEIVDFLKNPKKYTDLGGKIPKGALLVGPPGTGKTLLAKAVAGEAHVPFFSLSGSDFVEMFVGVGASRVRDLFKQAKEKAPCIIFIDEIDAIGRARGKNPNMGANDERENTLNQLLTEMDGFGTNLGVIILAATNRADILDRALLRAGRFDRQISVELPDLKERQEIFKVHLKPIKYDKENIDISFFAKQTPGFSGADIANVCNESALIAARRGKKVVEKQDFLDAIDRVIGGLEKKNKIITAQEKKTIAYHEAGHATVSWLIEHANPLVKVTIVPRGKALGAAWYLPEERQITTREQILDQICATLGGRASEEVNFGKISTGALNDLERVTKQAYAMVSYFGMSEKIGNVSFFDSMGQSEYAFNKPYSEETAELIDKEAKTIIEEQYLRAINILTENKDKLTELSELLLKREVIFTEDLEKIFGKRDFGKTRWEEIEELNHVEADNSDDSESDLSIAGEDGSMTDVKPEEEINQAESGKKSSKTEENQTDIA